MYSIVNQETNEVIRSFNSASDAAWMQYSLQRRGYQVEIQRPPSMCHAALVADIDFIDLGEFASCLAGAEV